MWSDLTLGRSFKVKQGEPNLKVLITRFLLVLDDYVMICLFTEMYNMLGCGHGC